MRWDGSRISNEFIQKLVAFIEPIFVCPEVEIGLGVPREPVRCVRVEGKNRLIQATTDLDVTERALQFIKSFLESLSEVEGFILKSRSPTCALHDSTTYTPTQRGISPISQGPGFFGSAVLQQYSHLAIVDDEQLINPEVKEHFLTRIFTLAKFRGVKSSDLTKSLVKFHTENKLLLTAYNPQKLKNLGRIVAERDEILFSKALKHYEVGLVSTLRKPPRRGSNINAILHAFGYFSKFLSGSEKRNFFDSLEEYKRGKISLNIVRTRVKQWAIQFQQDYLIRQTFFDPYPRELMSENEFPSHSEGERRTHTRGMEII